MKEVFYSIMFLLLVSAGDYAQGTDCLYLPMKAGTSWKYTNGTGSDTLVSMIVDSTTMNNKTYYKYAPYGEGPFQNWPVYWLHPEADKIYTLNSQDSTEYVVFDFTAEPNQNWNIPPELLPPSYQPLNQCDWGSSVGLISTHDTVSTANRIFYNCYHFVHNEHPCTDAGFSDTWFALDFGMVRFVQITEADPIEWNLIINAPDTLALVGTYSIVGNPCLTSPCLPGVVSAVTVVDTNYILTAGDNFFWNADFSWNDYIPEPGDSVLAEGTITVRTDLLGRRYFTLEIIDFKKILPADGLVNSQELNILENSINQNYPNPFNPETRIEYFMAEPARVKIILYDILGRKVKTVMDEYKGRGNYSLTVDGRDLPSGQYYYQFLTDDIIRTKSMILVK